MVGGLIEAGIGIAAMATLAWILIDMGHRDQPKRGLVYAALFFFLWPVGLTLWLATRNRYQRPPSN